MKLRLGLVAIAAVIVGAAALLAGSTSEEPVMRVAFLPGVGHAIPIVGMETGVFAESLGNKTRIDSRILDSGTQAVQSLLSGNLDIAYVGPGPAVNAFVRADKKDIVIISGAASGGVSLIAHKDSEIAGAAGLDGARIAVPQIANTQDVSLRTYLADHNISTTEYGGNTSVIAAAGPEMYTLFARDSVDAAWAPEPWATLIVESLGAKRVFHESELWPDAEFASVVLITRTGYADSHKSEIDAWLEAHEQTADLIRADPQEALRAYASFAERNSIASLPADILETSFANIEITTDPIEPSILVFAERAADLGYLGRSSTSIDGIFYKPVSEDARG